MRANRRWVIALSLAVLGVLSLGPSSAGAAMFGSDLNFDTANQSMWAPGTAAQLNYNYFLGPQWNVAPFSVGGIANVTTPSVTLVPQVCAWGVCTPAVTIPAANLGSYGAELSGQTDGRIGFDLNLAADSGSVNVAYPVGVTLEYPDPRTVLPGETFTVSTGFTEGAAAMSTNFPEASLDLDFVFDVYAKAGVEVCVVGCAGLDIGPFDYNETLNLLTIDSNTAQVDFDIAGFGTIGASVPNIDTAGGLAGGQIQTSGEDNLLDVDVDVDKIATTALGLPPLGATFDVLGAEAGYDIINVLIGAQLQVVQTFSFEPTLMVELALSTGGSQVLEVGQSLDIVMPGSTLGITPTFFLANKFTNTTSLRIDPTFDFELLHAWLTADFPDIVNSLGVPDANLNLGPLYETHQSVAGPAIPIFANSWALPFDTFTMAQLEVKPAPEPATLVLLGTGLLGVAGYRRKRPKRST